MIGGGGVLGIETLRRGVQQAEAFAGHAGDDFRRHAPPGPGLAHAQQPARPRHRGHDRVCVQRFHRAQVHYFDLRPFGGQFLRRRPAPRAPWRCRPPASCRVRPRQARPAHRHRLGGQSLGLEMIIEILVLAKNNRVVKRNRLEQHAVGVFHRGGREHHQARIMRVEALQALAMERARRRKCRRTANGW